MHNNSNKQSNLVISWQNIRKQAKQVWLWLLRKDLLIFGLFVGLAFIFWWGHAMSSPRDVDVRIPITYIGATEQVVFAHELPETLTLTVRDNGRQLRQITRQNLHLNVNLTPYLSTIEGTVAISAEVLRPRLQDLLPGSTTIQRIEPEIIESAYYLQQTKTVPIVVCASVSTAPQHHIIGDAQTMPDSAEIFGSQQQIDSISSILTDSIHISNLRDSMRMTASLIAPDGIRVSPSAVQVTWHAEQFTEKSFTLPIRALNVPAGNQMRLFPQQVEVTVRVGISHFSDVKESDFQAICRFPAQQCDALPIELTTTNPYIYNIRISPSSVEYMIQY